MSANYIMHKRELHFKENTSLTYDSVNNITCFVGENGVGKSTVLELIIKILLDEEMDCDYQFIFKSNGKIYSKGTNRIQIDGINIIERFNKRKFYNTNICYYSPIYNPHQAQSIKRRKIVKDLSSDNLYKYSRAKNREVDLVHQFKFLSEMSIFAEKKLSFEKYFDISFKEFNFQIIKRRLLEIISNIRRLDENSQKRFLSNVKAYFPHNSDMFNEAANYIQNRDIDSLNELNIKMSMYFKEIQTRYNEEISNYSLLKQIKLTLFLKYFFESTSSNKLRNKKNNEKFIRERIFSVLILTAEKSVGDWADGIISFMGDLGEDSNLKKVHESYLTCKKIFRGYESEKMPLKFNANEAERVIDIISDLRKNNLHDGIFFYKWRGVSSGQLAKLNFYSRIFSGFENNDSKELLLILDEADIYLHPDWQIQFFSDLFIYLRELKLIYKNLDSINIIMTTHSPLMLTDLFSGSVFQMSLKNGIRKIDKKNELTFASNIYDLYVNEFSVEDPMGNFASKKIEDLIENAKSNNLEMEDLEILSNIGEPIIKTSIENLIKIL